VRARDRFLIATLEPTLMLVTGAVFRRPWNAAVKLRLVFSMPLRMASVNSNPS
jgi:hypothetical protein